MREMKVICSRHNQSVDRIEVVREITNDDGTVEYNCLSLPTNRLEWISAEYGIEDPNELVEIAIYESFMPPANAHVDEATARAQARQALSSLKARLGPMRPVNNKAIQKARLQTAGIPEVFVDAIDDDAVDVIKLRSSINPIEVAKKREFIRARRNGEDSNLKPVPRVKSPNGSSRKPRAISVELPIIEMSKGKRIR